MAHKFTKEEYTLMVHHVAEKAQTVTTPPSDEDMWSDFIKRTKSKRSPLSLQTRYKSHVASIMQKMPSFNDGEKLKMLFLTRAPIDDRYYQTIKHIGLIVNSKKEIMSYQFDGIKYKTTIRRKRSQKKKINKDNNMANISDGLFNEDDSEEPENVENEMTDRDASIEVTQNTAGEVLNSFVRNPVKNEVSRHVQQTEYSSIQNQNFDGSYSPNITCEPYSLKPIPPGFDFLKSEPYEHEEEQNHEEYNQVTDGLHIMKYNIIPVTTMSAIKFLYGLKFFLIRFSSKDLSEHNESIKQLLENAKGKTIEINLVCAVLEMAIDTWSKTEFGETDVAQEKTFKLSRILGAFESVVSGGNTNTDFRKLQKKLLEIKKMAENNDKNIPNSIVYSLVENIIELVKTNMEPTE